MISRYLPILPSNSLFPTHLLKHSPWRYRSVSRTRIVLESAFSYKTHSSYKLFPIFLVFFYIMNLFPSIFSPANHIFFSSPTPFAIPPSVLTEFFIDWISVVCLFDSIHDISRHYSRPFPFLFHSRCLFFFRSVFQSLLLSAGKPPSLDLVVMLLLVLDVEEIVACVRTYRCFVR